MGRTRAMSVAAVAAGLLFAVVACGGSDVGGTARALPSRPDVTALRLQGVSSVDLRKKFQETPQQINNYWTAQRMRDAKPLNPGAPTTPSSPSPTPPGPTTPKPTAPKPTPTPTPRTSARHPSTPRSSAKPKPKPSSTSKRRPKPKPTPKPEPRPSTRPPTAAPPSPRDPGANTIIGPTSGRPNSGARLSPSYGARRFGKPGLTKSTAGRLYFTQKGQPYVCSGTVVASRKKNIVATSAHCVWDTETRSGWNHNFLFIPDDSNNGGNHPYGRWPAQLAYTNSLFIKTATATARGTSGEGWAYDTAFLKMAEVNGRKIQSVTGGQGIAFGVPVRSIMQIGYPTAPPFDNYSGERYCASPNWFVGAYQDLGHRCRMTGGASGGGWLTSFNSSSGAGYLVGTTSTGDGQNMYASQLGATALNTYNYAQGDSS